MTICILVQVLTFQTLISNLIGGRDIKVVWTRRIHQNLQYIAVYFSLLTPLDPVVGQICPHPRTNAYTRKKSMVEILIIVCN